MVALAGGEDVLGVAAERSRTVLWEEVEAARPDVLVSMPCGYDAERSARETLEHRDRIGAVGARTVVAVDAAAYFSRPGPRLIDGLEILACLLHPSLVAAPPPGRFIPLSPAGGVPAS